MRIRRTLAVAISGFAIVASAAVPALAHTSHPATSTHGTFPSTLSSHTAKVGKKLTLKAHGAEKKKSYLCLFAIVKGKAANGPNINNSTTVTSSSKGKFKCSLTFKKFSENVAGKTVSCPISKANAKAGYKCGFVGVDPQNSQKSNTIQYLTAK